LVTIGNKQVPTGKNRQVTTEKLLEAVFPVVPAAVVTKQRRGKHTSAATNPDTTIEELCFLGPCKGIIRRTIEAQRGLEPVNKEIAIVRSWYPEISSEGTAGWKRLKGDL
jgi:hypothetical protein